MTKPAPIDHWSRRWDSNPQPAVYKTAALPIELRRQCFTNVLYGKRWHGQIDGMRLRIGLGRNSSHASVLDHLCSKYRSVLGLETLHPTQIHDAVGKPSDPLEQGQAILAEFLVEVHHQDLIEEEIDGRDHGQQGLEQHSNTILRS